MGFKPTSWMVWAAWCVKHSPLTHVALVLFPAKTSCEPVRWFYPISEGFLGLFSFRPMKKNPLSNGVMDLKLLMNSIFWGRIARPKYKVGSQVESYTQNQDNLKQSRPTRNWIANVENLECSVKGRPAWNISQCVFKMKFPYFRDFMSIPDYIRLLSDFVTIVIQPFAEPTLF